MKKLENNKTNQMNVESLWQFIHESLIDKWVYNYSCNPTFFFFSLFLIREVGLQNREIDAIYTKKPVCSNRGNTFISVGIVDCYPPAVVLAGGIIISLFLFILEHCVHSRYEYKLHMLQRFNFIMFQDKIDKEETT